MRIEQINPRLSKDQLGRAFNYAKKIYNEKKRLSGQTMIDHCAEIALELAEINLGSPSVITGLLHEALEKTDVNRLELKKEFGEEVVFLVEGVTNVGKVEHKGVKRSMENLRKLFLATAKDIRVVIIKLINRLHGLKTISVFDKEKQRRLAQETLEIYAPIAYRLSMRKISGELEDAAFPLVYPQEYKWLLNQVKDKYQERDRYLNRLMPIIKRELEKINVVPLEIHSRAKRYFSLFKKLQRYDMDLNKIYDLVALRILVKDIDDCYAALGVIHKLWRPLPGRIKDYIALPKPNGYRSLHTTVFCPGGKITEFQIRTPEMHKEAEYGIAAHWYYSEQKGLMAYIKRLFYKPPEKELTWVKELQEWQKEQEADPQFIQSLKIDLFKDQIFVFTPKGDLIDLPEGATPIDFAYRVHTAIGHRCVGAKIEGKLVSLDQPLNNGQVVEIVTQNKEKPSRDWLNFVKTNFARNKIKNWFKRNRVEIIGLQEPEIEEAKPTPKIIQPPPIRKKRLPLQAVEIKGETRILTNFAKCCHPQVGDEIIGYITLNRGISVHKISCSNIKKLKNTERLIPVSWRK